MTKRGYCVSCGALSEEEFCVRCDKAKRAEVYLSMAQARLAEAEENVHRASMVLKWAETEKLETEKLFKEAL